MKPHALVVALLERAMELQGGITIAYNGGSRPGQPRTVFPIDLSADKLIAAENGSHVHKTYKLALIAWAELPSGERATNADVLPAVAPKASPYPLPEVPSFPTLAEYVEHFRAELESTGWHLHENADSFGAGTRFKNGKPKKSPSIYLRYFDPTIETIYDPDLEQFVSVPRNPTRTVTDTALVLSVGADGKLDASVKTQERTVSRGQPRPWRVDSWRLKSGKTFRELQQAFAFFMNEARSSDPRTAKGAFSGH